MNNQSSTQEKTELEKMRSGQMYYFSDPAILPMFEHAKRICAKLRTRSVYDEDYRELIEELIPGLPQSTEVTPPFHCDMGSEIRIGENTFINYNCVMLDAGGITIGKNCLVGPNCSFYTPQHPMDYIERREPKETPHPIHIGDDCWLGGNGKDRLAMTNGQSMKISHSSGNDITGITKNLVCLSKKFFLMTDLGLNAYLCRIV